VTIAELTAVVVAIAVAIVVATAAIPTSNVQLTTAKKTAVSIQLRRLDFSSLESSLNLLSKTQGSICL